MRIVTEKRSFDWIAYIRDSFWECGKTEIEAIGKLMISISVSQEYDITIVNKEFKNVD